MQPTLPSPWKAGCLGAVSLTFDDGLRSQRERALPILDELGLRATFYLNPRGEDWLAQLAPWREAVERGHEVGNHTITHPCSRALRADPRGPCLEELTLAELEADIVEASRRLRGALPEQGEFTFCYPCYQEHVGEGAARQSYVPLVARHFVAGRGRGEFGYNFPATCDLSYLYSWNAEFMAGPALVGLAEQAAAQSCWTVFTIHGLNEGHLPLAEVAFRELCGHLARSQERLWVAPVVEVAQAVCAWRSQQPPPRPEAHSSGG